MLYVLTSFLPSTTGNVWHCCVECGFHIRECILWGDVAAPPTSAVGWESEGEREGERERGMTLESVSCRMK